MWHFKKQRSSTSLCCVVSLAQTIDVQRGAALFRTSCIGCHDTGGNIIQPVSLHLPEDLIYDSSQSYAISYSLFSLFPRVQHSSPKIYKGNGAQSKLIILSEICNFSKIRIWKWRQARHTLVKYWFYILCYGIE